MKCNGCYYAKIYPYLSQTIDLLESGLPSNVSF